MKRVVVFPGPDKFDNHESGIKRVVEAYTKYLPHHGFEVVGPDDGHDLVAIHAGSSSMQPDVAHCHGLYWTADYPNTGWEYRANEHVIDSIRHAKQVTVPSKWVQEVFQRDMRFSPHVIGHGIDWKKWANKKEPEGFTLWNKNRAGDVCDPYPVHYLAKLFPDDHFVTTFSRPAPPRNVHVTGLLPHEKMMDAVKSCSVYLATTKETFGIGILEAMAAGRPVLGFAWGGALDLVEHGVSGYLAEPNNFDDLVAGYEYCKKYWRELGEAGAKAARQYSWDKIAGQVAEVYKAALVVDEPLVDIIIPVYNKEARELHRAVATATGQTKYLGKVIVVDDGSRDEFTDDYAEICAKMGAEYHKKENGGVATARNYGISLGYSKYVVCLDADDALADKFLEVCVPELEKDRSLGIAYTGLWYIKPDGSDGLSPWPGEFNYDKQLKKQNQIPTACVFRRAMWSRLGGYRQRYAPRGAGAEDAEFWLRSGAYGWGAKKVTDAGLFIYSWMSGQVTSDPGYVEPNWLEWHPWTRDKKHPFASVATPERMSHPVRQYDEPVVSVVIPVGPGHQGELITALDSLEAQTYRKWEAIVVNDTGEDISRVLFPYPYVRKVTTGMVGAGAARNAGVAEVRAPFILFLDADDFLYPDAITMMIQAWNKTGNGIYTDYIGKSHVDDVGKLAPNLQADLIKHENGEATIRYRMRPYDCDTALKQPDNPPYIWCNITTLIPRAWHEEIGGFDETMESWEDVDYWWRMAWSGKCFSHIAQPLLQYRFYSGSRRDTGVRNWDKLLEYTKSKRKEFDIMGCGCGNNSAPSPAPPVGQSVMNMTKENAMLQDVELVMIRYISPNKGQHGVTGQATRKFYGYRAGGDEFLVHRDDVALQPHLFIPVGDMVRAPERVARHTPPPPMVSEPPQPVSTNGAQPVASETNREYAPIENKGFDPQILPGVTPTVADAINNSGVTTFGELRMMSVEDLQGAFKGVGATKAQMIKSFLDDHPDLD